MYSNSLRLQCIAFVNVIWSRNLLGNNRDRLKHNFIRNLNKIIWVNTNRYYALFSLCNSKSKHLETYLLYILKTFNICRNTMRCSRYLSLIYYFNYYIGFNFHHPDDTSFLSLHNIIRMKLAILLS